MAVYVGIQQGTPEWRALRRGKVTGTRSFDVCSTDARGNTKAAYDKLLDKLALELISGDEEENFVSEAMRIGTVREPIARTLFSLETGFYVREVAFVDHPVIPLCGCSPDGLIDVNNSSLEIKCPQPNTQYSYWIKNVVPPNYMAQIVHGFACMPEIQQCYFVSYNPDVELKMQLFVKVVKRDDAVVAKHEERVRTFVNLLEQRISEMEGRLAKI